MDLYSILFYLFAFILVGTAFYAVTTRDIVRAVFALFAVFFCVSAILVFAHADLLAIAHLVVYVGGILVVMVFAIMLSNKKVLDLVGSSRREKRPVLSLLHIFSAFVCGFVLYVLLNMFCSDFFDQYKMSVLPSSVERTGVELMTAYIFPFELISFLLLFALIAAAFIARKERRDV